ncbi:MAG TPA: nucleotidyltransferase domain-containing protein [Solirubrobacterales bacterium]|nr:nucleotidyltransferase domain-containing protein [Solirubrobacterales bacterium]
MTVLAGTSRPLTGREVARLVGRASHSGVIAALERLVDQGVVDREEAGRAFLFTLNREHLAAPAVEVLADLREELLRRIRDRVERWNVKARHLSLFGSAARGDGGLDSDIDLFVVRFGAIERQEPVWREQVDLLGWQVERWTGNPARIVEVEEREVAPLREERPPIVDELLADAIGLVGPDVSALLGTA